MTKFDDSKKEEILNNLTNEEKDRIVIKYFEIADNLPKIGVDSE
ncbi:hypothetical protein [uncultured Methanobrevibacter sp.]|nr:hypothetical protein [uncultured Methanobrevibacter sp.]